MNVEAGAVYLQGLWQTAVCTWRRTLLTQLLCTQSEDRITVFQAPLADPLQTHAPVDSCHSESSAVFTVTVMVKACVHAFARGHSEDTTAVVWAPRELGECLTRKHRSVPLDLRSNKGEARDEV